MPKRSTPLPDTQVIPAAAFKFHLAKYLGEAVNKVRRQEHKALTALMAQGNDALSFGTHQVNDENHPRAPVGILNASYSR